jgi:YVTN family beta-propeller protein
LTGGATHLRFACLIVVIATGCGDGTPRSALDSAQLAALDSATALGPAHASPSRDRSTNIYAATTANHLTATAASAVPVLAPTMKESMSQDIRSSPDGSVFYVADMKKKGMHVIDPAAMRYLAFIPTGKGAHGITIGRGGGLFYISNRGWNTIMGGRRGPGSISVLDPRTQKVLETWPIPKGGSPDMGNVSADGKELWLSGRHDDEVYVFDTSTGKLTDRIAVGREPHGLTVWPQPGRYSLAHTGNMR